jgi:predicted Ser/Thr protein kinase
MSLPVGTLLGPYEIVGVIGAGGMGEVYRARDSRLGRDVALKILPADVAADSSRRQRFEVEARAVAALNHPNIVAIYDVGEGYIVTELVDGEPLRPGKLSLRKTLDAAAQIAAGLACAHEAGIVHRDLKPDNILLTRDGRVKILDFGLAKLTGSRSPAASSETVTVHTEPGKVMGTVSYMSPEQVRGAEVDHRSDIFSFGLILFELLGGKPAFQGETSVEIMTAILRQDAPELPDRVPAGVRQIVAHCLEKEPVNRFQSVRDLGFALSQTATRSGAVPVARPSRWRRRVLLVSAVLVVAAAFGIATRFLWRAPGAPQWSGMRLGGPEIAIGPRISPDGHLLAFQAMDQGLTQVALMKPETGNWSTLTHRRDRGQVLSLSWPADGARIYYDRITDVPQGIYSVPVLGGEEHLVLENAFAPEALPDGSLLVERINGQGQYQWFRFWPESGRLLALPLVSGSLLGSQARFVPGGKMAVVWAEELGPAETGYEFLGIDLATNAVRRLQSQRHYEGSLHTWGVGGDRAAVLATIWAGAVTRVVSIPLTGKAPEQTLFTTTQRLHNLDGGPDGSVYASLIDRAPELVRLSLHGGVPERIASLIAITDGLDMSLPLPDGRTAVAEDSGHLRLVAVENGKDPVPLINTTEDTSAPIALAGPLAIAFLVGPYPHETIAVADVASGSITSRIAPAKGTIDSLAASPDGGTLYFAARSTIWAIPAAGGQPRRICAGYSAAMDPKGRDLVVQRSERTRSRLFQVPLDGGSEQEIPIDSSSPLDSFPLSPGAVGPDGRLAVSLMPPDSWFNPPAILDPATGHVTRVPADPFRDYHFLSWTPDGQVVSVSLGLHGALWKFTPEAR